MNCCLELLNVYVVKNLHIHIAVEKYTRLIFSAVKESVWATGQMVGV
jgi:hypothetical protein